MNLLIATQNKGKVAEYQKLLADTGFNIISLSDLGLSHLQVAETGTSFEENARLKAQTYMKASQTLTLADDSGLEVDALQGAPGIYSARYGDPAFDDAARRTYLLQQMQASLDDEARTARFRCVIALANPHTEKTITVNGTCEGHILKEDQDDGHGFGYDAIFQPIGYGYSFAQLSSDIKNKLSHRGIAIKKLKPILETILKHE